VNKIAAELPIQRPALAWSPDGRRLAYFTAGPSLAPESGTIGAGSLTIDRQAGIVYLAWVSNKDQHSRITISRSIDAGQSWQSSPALEVGPLINGLTADVPSIAVGKDGVLGMAWP
jgi:hypothetical protein